VLLFGQGYLHLLATSVENSIHQGKFSCGFGYQAFDAATLVDWMATAHKEFELLQEKLHLSVYALDCFLSLAGQKVTPKTFFLYNKYI
jgi:hypothetical protein